MRRRQFLAAAGVITSGCLTTGPSDDIPEVSVAAEDATVANPDVSLSVAYNSTVDTELPTDPTTLAEDGHKWLLIRMDVTNRMGISRELTSYQYTVDEIGERDGPVRTKEPWSLLGKNAQPGETVTGWVVFHPPRSLTDATLSARGYSQTKFAVTFTHDDTLNADPPT